MKCIAVLMSVCLIAGCKQTAIEQKLADTDSVMVQFFNKESGMIEMAITSTEQSAIKKLKSFLDGKIRKAPPCDPTGKLQFFLKGKLLLEADYSIKGKECRHFTYVVGDSTYHVSMSLGGADFLRSLRTDSQY